MGRYNVYYNPKRFGLEPVAEIDYRGNYDFDKRVIWRHAETGLLYTGRDSGCSCPPPFEDYGSLESLDRFVLSEVEDEVRTELKRKHYEWDDPTGFLEKVRAAAIVFIADQEERERALRPLARRVIVGD